MLKIKKNIKSLYEINLIEGEGVGTAYEYYTKLNKLNKFINSMGKPSRILIAGLPEKYGLSMDFFLLGKVLRADIVAIDERSSTLERAKKALSILKSRKLLVNIKVTFLKVDQISEFNRGDLINEKFDLALSCEVLQRLDEAQRAYVSNLKKAAKYFAIFVPNRDNESHANLSGLKSLYLKELLKFCLEDNPGTTLYDYGYIDMPPFPPGLTRSQEKREQASKNRLENFLMKGLEFYSLLEDIIPPSIKKQFAHITYVMGKSR